VIVGGLATLILYLSNEFLGLPYPPGAMFQALLDLPELILDFILAVGLAAYVTITAYLALFYNEIATPHS